MSAGMTRDSSPRGPFTVIRFPSRVMLTPEGTVIGFFPMRDICRFYQLPDEGEYLAAGARLARLAVGHQARRWAGHRQAEAGAGAEERRPAGMLARDVRT